ncbi:MAG TPA: ABC transporter ATP-binding protein [Desulfopila sp.]|nr:ABC transporter ATP-binding protein [Desulfopila sp.]
MTETQPILEVNNLRKVYKTTVAVEDVSLTVRPGTCLGLLGPNGAGKTTTIEILEDIFEPTAGTIYYKGQPRRGSFREEVGIQFQHTSLLNYLTVKETLRTFISLYANPEDFETLVQRCELGTLLQRRNNKLSGGQQQRLMLALAMVNRPSLIFLDEPSTGLDPQSRRNLWQIVDQIKAEGKTIILTTHSMEEAEYLCDEVAIMDKGRIIAEGSPEALIKEYCGSSAIFLPLSVDTRNLENLPYVWQQQKDRIRIDCDDIYTTIAALSTLNIDLSGMSISSANLEDVFLQLTGRQLRD